MELDISTKEFNELRGIIHSLIGITLNEGKKMLVISRLAKRLKVLGLAGFNEYIDYLKSSSNADEELIELINSITTNKTDFFREPHHFRYLQQTYLPMMSQTGKHEFRLWSAGCSTGEEPYTLAMVLEHTMKNLGQSGHVPQVKILATDVDTTVLAKAQKGEYRKDHLKDIPEQYRMGSLKTGPDTFQILPALQSKITFGRFNLMHQFPFKHGFDVIFCRNVLIYFNQDDRMSIIRKFSQVINDNGLLILGHSESLLADQVGFVNLGNTIYQKRQG